MAIAEAPLTGFAQAEQGQDLALSWRRLTRAATIVAFLTAVPSYGWLTPQRDWSESTSSPF